MTYVYLYVRQSRTQPAQAIKADSQSPWGYERRHAALHGLQRYDEAMDAFTRMLSLIDGSDNQDIRRQCHFASAEILP